MTVCYCTSAGKMGTVADFVFFYRKSGSSNSWFVCSTSFTLQWRNVRPVHDFGLSGERRAPAARLCTRHIPTVAVGGRTPPLPHHSVSWRSHTFACIFVSAAPNTACHCTDSLEENRARYRYELRLVPCFKHFDTFEHTARRPALSHRS